MQKKSSKIEISCSLCEKVFERWPYEKYRKFCSHQCASKARKTKKKVLCDFCSKNFEKPFSELKRTKFNFCQPKCYQMFNRGSRAFRFKNGSLTQDGYKVIYVNGKRILEHRYVMEKFLNRKLSNKEIVHHIDENKLNNQISNLQITDRKEHRTIHKTGQWSRKYNRCIRCHETSKKHEAHGYCIPCYGKYRRELKNNLE